MGERPEGASLDRIDNDANYSKENCRWTNRKEQSQNRRGVRPITFNGQTKTAADWSRELGVRADRVSERLRRGFTFEEALTTPFEGTGPKLAHRKGDRHLTFKGKTQTIKAWCQETGLKHSTIHNRLHRNFSIERVLEPLNRPR